MGRNSVCRLVTSNTEPDPGALAAARELREIAQRHTILGELICADIGWSLLLWMLVLEESGVDVPTGDLLQKIGARDDTGNRWLALLEHSGFVSFHDGAQKKRAYVALTAIGREKTIAALDC